jgi:hypothetical protein
MSDLVSQDQVRAARHEVDLSLSKQGAYGAAVCWLAFYALAVVSVVVANFHQAIKTTLIALH